MSSVPCPALPCPALPCPALPCPALPCPALPCPVQPCPVQPCPALPCPALSSLALSSLALSCPACPALPCLLASQFVFPLRGSFCLFVCFVSINKAYFPPAIGSLQSPSPPIPDKYYIYIWGGFFTFLHLWCYRTKMTRPQNVL